MRLRGVKGREVRATAKFNFQDRGCSMKLRVQNEDATFRGDKYRRHLFLFELGLCRPSGDGGLLEERIQLI
jgi:hypothetical protein